MQSDKTIACKVVKRYDSLGVTVISSITVVTFAPTPSEPPANLNEILN